MSERALAEADPEMSIRAAQREMRSRFAGGYYGQLVSGTLWLASAILATWSSPRLAITALVLGGFFIFPITELLIRMSGRRVSLSSANSLRTPKYLHVAGRALRRVRGVQGR